MGVVFKQQERAKREKAEAQVSQECLGWCRLSLERVKYPNRKIILPFCSLEIRVDAPIIH